MKRFVKFTENNDHEGESWNFWLQLDGNEEALRRLAEILDADTDDNDPEYEIDLGDNEDETAVDVLVKHTGGGYMDFHNKVTGRLVVPTDLDVDDLYKGGIVKLFAEAPRG